MAKKTSCAKKRLVCSACGSAKCAAGEWMCDQARTASFDYEDEPIPGPAPHANAGRKSRLAELEAYVAEQAARPCVNRSRFSRRRRSR